MGLISEAKNFSEPEPRRLPELHEARGVLLSVFCRDGFTVCAFSWGAVAFPAEMREELAALVGKECAILRLNGYHCRAVE